MNDSILSEWATRDEVEYKPVICDEDVCRSLLDKETPYLNQEQSVSQTLNRSMLLDKGIVPLSIGNSIVLVVDPRVNNLRSHGNGYYKTLADFLSMRFFVSERGMRDFVEKEFLPEELRAEPEDGGVKFAYAPQSIIDGALSCSVQGYAERSKLRENYKERMNIVMNEVYRKLLDFRNRKVRLTVPREVRKMMVKPQEQQGWKSEPLVQMLRKGEGWGIPVHYDDKVWPTIFWLLDFTTPVSYIHSIFEDYDNLLEGNHLEQRVTFSDPVYIARHNMDGIINDHLAMCLSEEELRGLPVDVNYLNQLRERIVSLEREGQRKFERIPLFNDDLLKDVARVRSEKPSFWFVFDFLRRNGPDSVIQAILGEKCLTPDLIDPCMNLGERKTRKIIKEIVKETI